MLRLRALETGWFHDNVENNYSYTEAATDYTDLCGWQGIVWVAQGVCGWLSIYVADSVHLEPGSECLWLGQCPCGWLGVPMAGSVFLWVAQSVCGWLRVPMADSVYLWVPQSVCGWLSVPL